jgi:hypothetical protein
MPDAERERERIDRSTRGGRRRERDRSLLGRIR